MSRHSPRIRFSGRSFAGIRYGSRLSSEWTCWAVFPGVELEPREALPIEREMPDLVAVAERFSLRVF